MPRHRPKRRGRPSNCNQLPLMYAAAPAHLPLLPYPYHAPYGTMTLQPYHNWYVPPAAPWVVSAPVVTATAPVAAAVGTPPAPVPATATLCPDAAAEGTPPGPPPAPAPVPATATLCPDAAAEGTPPGPPPAPAPVPATAAVSGPPAAPLPPHRSRSPSPSNSIILILDSDSENDRDYDIFYEDDADFGIGPAFGHDADHGIHMAQCDGDRCQFVVEAGTLEEDSCTICCEEYVDAKFIGILHNCHCFRWCYVCAERLLAMDHRCPRCRRAITAVTSQLYHAALLV